MEENIAKVPLKEVAQSPLAYALYVVVVVLGGVIVAQRLDLRTERISNDKNIERLEAMVTSERKEKDQVFKSYLAERLANEQIQKAVDSTAIKNKKR